MVWIIRVIKLIAELLIPNATTSSAVPVLERVAVNQIPSGQFTRDGSSFTLSAAASPKAA
jgi:hypothetical protein